MTKLALNNPIAVLMASVGLVVFAAVVVPRMSVDTFPELTPPVLVVGTLAPGLGPKDVEKTLTWRIEKYVSATPGIDHVESVSRNNLSIVYVWMKWGTDLNSAQTLVQQQVAFAMSAVPKSLGVIPPFVLQYDPSNAPVVQVTVSGGGLTGPQLYDFALNNIEPVLEGIPGVASASLNGGRQRQINVVVDPARARARGVTTAEISLAVAQANALLPSGVFLSPRFDSNVYTNAIPEHVETLGEAPVKVVGGKRAVAIRDVARVEDSGSPETQAVSVDGRGSVYLNVLRVPGGNTLKIVEEVKKTLASLEGLPKGVEVKAVFDQSTFVRTSYEGLKREVVQALLLIALVILVFLQSARGTLVVTLAIPLAFGATLIVLSATGNSLNAFTLGGLTLAMGPLVDTAVVVLESIHRHQHGGLSLADAARKGTEAVALPVLASTLTTLSVLMPVVLLAGLAQRLFVPLALTVATAMTASYVVSMTVTPAAARVLLGSKPPGALAQMLAARIARLADAYARALGRVLGNRGALIAGALALVLTAGFAAKSLPSSFFPEIDESMERVYVRLAPGLSLSESSARIEAMGEALRQELPKGTVELVLTNVGAPANARSAMSSPNNGPHMGFIRLALGDPEHRTLSQREVADRSREILQRRFPGVEFLQWPGGLVASVFSNGFSAPLVVEVHGDDLRALRQQAQAVYDVARSVSGVVDPMVSLETDYPEVHVNTRRNVAGLVGVSARTAAQATLDATLGNVNTPSVWIDPKNGQSYYVVTSYDAEDVRDPARLAEVPARVASDGRAVPLGAYAEVKRSAGATAIERSSLERVAHVLMQTEGRDLGSTAAALEAALKADPRTASVPFRFVGQVDLMRTTFSSLGLAISLAVMLVFMIMASQFKSLRLPFVMLFTIPGSLVGIVSALLIAGQGFSVTALMGVLMVVGIAVANGILLVDEADRRFQGGAALLEATVQGARTRFVPILMTSLATIIGLLPTALGLEAGSEANRPLALAVVGGLTSSTILSLFLVPSIYTLVAKRRAKDEERDAPAAPPAPVAGHA